MMMHEVDRRRWIGRILKSAYRALSSQKFPYFYPLAGPATGLSLLAEWALPYPMPSLPGSGGGSW